MSGNLEFIDQLGMGEPSFENTESQEENIDTKDVRNNIDSDESQDFVQDSELTEGSETEESQEDTAPNGQFEELRKQIEGIEKRLKDKDDYINEMREQSMSKEKAKQEPQEDDVVDDEDAFYSDPIAYVKSIKEEMARQQHIQQLQLAEIQFSNTVDNYWQTVNGKDLNEAIAADKDFAEKFNSSKEPYKDAYDYLIAKKAEKTKSEQSLREQIRAEEREKLLKEIGSKKKETVPNYKQFSGSSSSKDAIDDGFMSVFGK